MSAGRYWVVVGCALLSVAFGLVLIRLGVRRTAAIGASVLIGCGLALIVAWWWS